MSRVALIGNPNVGKTELFNKLTGMKQHVGNWPGVTVEKKTGKCTYNGEAFEIVDLPGTYSLTANAIDELVAREYIVEEQPDVVINIVNATSLERNLYLTLLLLELEANVVVALNQWDMVTMRGIDIDLDKLSEFLGVPVVPTVAPTGEGVEVLKKAVFTAVKNKGTRRKIVMGYGNDIESLINKVRNVICKDESLSSKYPPRWLAIKTLEKDDKVLKLIGDSSYKCVIMETAK